MTGFRLAHCMLAALALSTAGACVVVSFKQGASSEAMAADERACREATVSTPDFVTCMRQRGWSISAPSEEPPASDSAPAAQTTPHRTIDDAGATPSPGGPTPTRKASGEASGAEGSETLVEVGSWWKLGGTPSGLESSIASCVAELGPESRPGATASAVTPELAECLRKAGWHPVGR